jgi:hypothetical protein
MSYSNRPIAPSPATVQEWLAETSADLVSRRDEILAGAARFAKQYPDGVPNEEVLGRVGDFAGGKGIMGAFIRECGNRRTNEKAPFLAGGKAVDGFFSTLTDPIERVQTQLRAQATAYSVKLEAERREKARQEAALLAAQAEIAQDHAIETMDEAALQAAADVSQAAEAAQALAEGSAAELSRVRGDLGTVVSLHTSWKADYEHADLLTLVKAVAAGKAPLAYLTFAETRINFAVRSEKVREIPGVPVVEIRKVV